MTLHRPATREETPFTWSATCGMAVYAKLARVRFDRLFLDADAIIEAYTKGRPLAEELIGPEALYTGPGPAGNSYVHVSALGAEMLYPEDSEVGVRPVYNSLDEAMTDLRRKRDIDFARNGVLPEYVRLRDRLSATFPDRQFALQGLKAEGPITTAWTLRGHDFFVDLAAEPEKTKGYLDLVTESVVRFQALLRRLNGHPEFTPNGVSLSDDVAAMISPAMWPEMVIPYMEAYFAQQTSGKRHAHIEDMRVAQVPFVDVLKLDRFEPAVSPRLTPALVRDHCTAPFSWRLNSTHYFSMNCDAVRWWVFNSVADGASEVFSIFWRDMVSAENAEKFRAFIRACKDVERLLAGGCSRSRLRENA